MSENAQQPIETGRVPGPEGAALPPPPDSEVSFDRFDWLSFGCTTVAALAVYLATLAPEVTLEFSGIFATGARYAGVPHPPGYPVWTLYAWLFARLLPVSNFAWRVALSSAFAGALACGIIALMVSRGGALMMAEVREFKKCEPKAEQWIRAVAGFVAGLAFGLDRAVWSQAVIVEAWTLGLLLFSLVLCLLLRWAWQAEQGRYLYAALFIYGLSLGTNQGLVISLLGLQMLLALMEPGLGRDVCLCSALLAVAALLTPTIEGLPGIVWSAAVALPLFTGLALALRTRRIFTNWKRILTGSVCLGLGLSPYLYPAVASMTNPPVNWAYPRTVEGYLHLITRRQYDRMNPVDSLSRFGHELWFYGKAAASDFGLLYLVVALVPFWFLRRMPSRTRGWLIGLGCLWICLSAFLVAVLNPTSDRASQDLTRLYYSPSHIILAVLTGYGLILLGSLLNRNDAGETTNQHE